AETDTNGKTYWKSFGELGRDPALMEQMQNEFPADYDVPNGKAGGITRRTFMGLLAASAALAATGCRRPEQEIVPYVKKPEYLTPGVANFFASAFSRQNFAAGILVTSREGRPIKIEGNDLCPVSGGKSTHLAQASLLSLYDPDRMLRPTVNNSDSTPLNAMRRIADAIREVTAQGRKVRIMVDEHASPSLRKLYDELARVLPDTRVVTWPALAAYGAAQANRELLGVDAVIVPDLSKAKVILGVDADFLGSDNESLYHIRQFARGRKPERDDAAMNRYYAVESMMTTSGSNADRRIRIKPGEINEFLRALLHEVAVVRGRGGLDAALLTGLRDAGNAQFTEITAIADDLLAHASVVMIGRHLPAETHALGLMLNQAIGAIGSDRVLDPRHTLPYSNDKTAEMEMLQTELRSGKVGVLIFGDVNPAYSMPGDMFRTLTSRVLYRFSLSQYADETSKSCSIFIPVNHYLEAWGDAAMFDGSQAVAQPLIAPLNQAQPSLADALMGIARAYDETSFSDSANFYAYVRARWEAEVFPRSGAAAFTGFWTDALREGSVRFAPAPADAGFRPDAAARMLRKSAAAPSAGMMLGVLPSHSLDDGRYANTGWLMELPDPVTKTTWDNLAIMSRATARALGVKQEDVVEVRTEAGTTRLPVFIQPGVADDVVITHTGFGRQEGGRVLADKGVNVFPLLPAGTHALGYLPVQVTSTGDRYPIATTQDHHSLSGDELYDIDRKEIVKEGSLADFIANPASLYRHDLPVYGAEDATDRPISITTPHDYSKGHRWGMTIDTSACVGCNACVVACVSENNIPMVGKEEVMNGREMHWIRIDRYYSGDEDNPDTTLQPMLCQHCEKAPCENVCPVAATTHSPEGLNEMTYNRCVGTRYCSNNCPYKVRRFNYLNYHEEDRDPLSLVFNPDVTVRMRGVMEKCTFCVQRINTAKYATKNEGRDMLRDGEVVTACQQACPADAIVFGNTNDAESAVSKSRQSERGYHVLQSLNIIPSITYKAKIRNTNGGAA
ncbi:MAG: TAT-variant-translocated molybdopterin oxidoreductase, partial [Bacteroidota bacterium]|nr:TAT-variant-translocated molybdopterin oxidoreductase [Bacteroidota bacterium]